MSGRHEPPTNRSFYVSVGTSILRFVIVLALVVGGVVLLNQAFPSGGTIAAPGGGGSTVPTSPPASPGDGKSSSKPPPTPKVVGVKIAVFNAAGVNGLAGDTALLLQRKFGYKAVQVADAPSTASETEVFYRSPPDKIEAEEMVRLYFKSVDPQISRLDPSATGVKKNVQVAVYLGTDFADLQK